MSVRVVLPGALREYAGGVGELDVTLDGPSTVGTVLDQAVVGQPRLGARIRDETGALRRHVNVFVDGQDCRASGGVDCPVQPTSVLHVIPAVSGG